MDKQAQRPLQGYMERDELNHSKKEQISMVSNIDLLKQYYMSLAEEYEESGYEREGKVFRDVVAELEEIKNNDDRKR